MKKKTTLVTMTAGLTLFAHLSSAEGPRIEPGEWEITTTMEMSMLPEPKVITKTDCISAEQAKSDPLAALVEEGHCTVLSQEESGNSIVFEIECAGDSSMPVKTRGTGEFTGDGKTLSGSMDSTTELPEMPDMPGVAGMPTMGGQVAMSQQWTGRYLGPCN